MMEIVQVRCVRPGVTLSVWAVLAAGLSAQIPPLGSLLGQAAAQSTPSAPADPIGRSTPRGALTAFITAVHRDDFATAARCLELTGPQRSNGESLARALTDLIDRHLNRSLISLSDTPTGALNDGLPENRERVGRIQIGDRSVDVELVRVMEPPVGPVWLISSETLAEVPTLHELMEVTWIERLMPESFVRTKFLWLSIAQWIIWAGSLALSFAGLCLLTGGFIVLVRRFVADPVRVRAIEDWYAATRWPLVTALTFCFHLASVTLVGLRFRIMYVRFVVACVVAAIAWLMWSLSSLSSDRARLLALRRGRTSTSSLVLLGERVLKVLIVGLAIFTILSVAGVDTRTALAGVGLGGVAVALGAQKSVENLLGGVFLLSDRALAVGDTCTIADRIGVVEDITLRSVRLRTMEQTLLSVPAGALSQANIENFATRRKILVKTTLRLRYGTTTQQLRTVLGDVRRLLAGHPQLETQTARIRLVDFGDRAVELELFAYVLTSDSPTFLAVREDLLLQIAGIVESSGSGFAQPTQFIYVDQNSAVNAHERDLEAPLPSA